MQIDVMATGAPLRRVADLAGAIGASRYDGIVLTEAGRTAYLPATAAALAADIDVSTGVAVAFARSPMVNAAAAWELAEATGGRFRLGLGTQVRAHVERRYGAEFDPPGPRMRDHLLAIRACFAAFRGDAPLDHHGPFHDLTLLPPMWSPGPIEVADPPLDLAAVNPWMLRLAGELADGVHVHPLNTATYLERTVLPELAAGAERADRTLDDVTVIVPAFLAIGDAEHQRRWREAARLQVAFYGSTPNYAFIFDQLGRDGTTDRLRTHQRAGDLTAMAGVIDDDLLDEFVVTATEDDAAAAVAARYGDVADRVIDYFGGAIWERDPDSLARRAAVLR